MMHGADTPISDGAAHMIHFHRLLATGMDAEEVMYAHLGGTSRAMVSDQAQVAS